MKQLDTLLASRMDRRNFLKFMGIGLLGVMGLDSLLKMAGPITGHLHSSSKQLGYGDSAYGGKNS